MIKFHQSQIHNHHQFDGFSQLSKYWKSQHNNHKNPSELPKSSLKTSVIAHNSGHEMIISTSGQVKIDNLNSCLDLDECDFIVF